MSATTGAAPSSTGGRRRAPGTGTRLATVDDHDRIRAVFARTLALGRPVTVDGLDAYARFCLDWYLDAPGGTVAVHTDDGVVEGYVLVCTDEEAFDRHQRRAALRYLLALVALAVRGGLTGDTWRFHRLRLLDGWYLFRHAPVRPAPAHLHQNLLPGARTGRVARALVSVADDAVAAAGHRAWYAEINAPVGRRAGALGRLGATVLHRAPNRTLTALAGEPVERLTVVRHLPAAG